ncbi:MAG: TatD family hydrolase [Chlamydiia bacterium]|nr:TatD family hydrolase [Chlamydiia bacterium]
MSLTDSHAHLTAPAVLPHLEEILQRSRKAEVSAILNICTDPESLRQGLLLASRHVWIRNAGATTPQDAAGEEDPAFPLFESAAQQKRLSAIGETGLDYYYGHATKQAQRRFLVRYLHLAERHRLPVIFHCRDAFADLFSITDAEYRGKAVLHCFTGSMEEALEGLRRGWYISFSGIVTFKKSASLRAIAKEVPLSQLLIETDTPYLAPQSVRGRPNEPAFLSETALCIAEVKGISLDALAQATTDNAKHLFGF